MSADKLTHVDDSGNPRMVDVGSKKLSRRTARAQTIVDLGEEIMSLMDDGDIKTAKGPVFHTAIVAGTNAVKQTANLIPFCHPLPVDGCRIEIEKHSAREIRISCEVSVEAKTGVEMEAIVGSSLAAITIYDMCKALSHDIVIRETKLMKKTGGKRDFSR